MDFDETLARLGFAPSQDRPSRGLRTYAAHPNPYLTYWVHAYDDGSALFTWEFAITDYLLERGMQLGSGETLNVYMFPARDERGRQESGWLVAVLDRAEAALRSIDFANPHS